MAKHEFQSALKNLAFAASQAQLKASDHDELKRNAQAIYQYIEDTHLLEQMNKKLEEKIKTLENPATE